MTATLAALEAEGFRQLDLDEPFEVLVGPLLLKEREDGTYKSAFIAEEKHANALGMVHGGMLMSFADYSLFSIARKEVAGDCVTVGFNSEFVSAAKVGERIESSGEIIRATRSLIFVRGTIYSAERTILSFSGILKRLKA